MTAALALARSRRVVLSLTERWREAPPRVDALPLPLLAVLVELGVHPARLGADRVYTDSLSSWESPDPGIRNGGRKAHVDRQRLERELMRRVEDHDAIVITTGAAPGAYRKAVDATGRRAITATSVREPPRRWLARTFSLHGSFSAAQSALRIAALPGGYGYRLGTSELITLGLVGPVGAIATAAEMAGQLEEAGAAWILAGLPPVEEMESGRGGVSSVQWTEAGSSAARIGDADFACDALASQGLAGGMSDAMQLDEAPAVRAVRAAHRRSSHLAHLCEAIARCRFSSAPAWRDYRLFLEAADPGGRKEELT
ncbi:MAG TPA: hypothetical protein VGX37_05130 [Allosphingosinicella sp.]|nr:hypothetical protein [Allosphingosinicella sp.]